MMYPLIALASPSVLIPPPAARAAAIVFFVLAGTVLAMHAVFTALAAQRTDLAPRTRFRAPVLVAAFLAIWLAIALVTGDAANFPMAPSTPRLVAVLTVMLVPFAVAVALLFTSRTMRAINAAMPTSWLVRVQSYRLAGFIFLFPFLYYGVVPGEFAWPAAVGDMLTGALALVVGHALARGRSGAEEWAIAWNAFGMLDLIVVPLAALHSAADVIGNYPLAIVPLFLGPPLGMLTHVYSLRNLTIARRARRVVHASAGRPAGAVPSAGRAVMGSL